jgi:predicted MPP superfamily phosphohydrolase
MPQRGSQQSNVCPTKANCMPSSPLYPTIRLLGPPGKWFQWGSPEGFEWTHVTLPMPDLSAELVGTRIIHLSDVHATARWHSAYDVLLDAIADADAELVVVTGDFVDDKKDHTAAVPTVSRIVERLTARMGVFAILGNHDRAHFEPRLGGSPVQLLNGGRRIVERNGKSIELIGVPGAEREDLTADWLAKVPPPTRGVPRIVLSHFPDHLPKLQRLHPDVVLAGHTHGGQICLPGGLVVWHNDKLPRRYNNGVHRIGGLWLVANRGLGFTRIPLRMFCPSEVIEIELVAAG